ncbi:hypothetical protein BGZ49_004314, partial [Haplosporangium sp. Z 27]
MPKSSTYARKPKTPCFSAAQSPEFFSDNEGERSDSELEEPNQQLVGLSLLLSSTQPSPLPLSSSSSCRGSPTIPPMSPIVLPMLSSAPPMSPTVSPLLSSAPMISPTAPPTSAIVPPTAPPTSAIAAIIVMITSSPQPSGTTILRVQSLGRCGVVTR